MPKSFLLTVLALSIPTGGAISQTPQIPCSPPGGIASQSLAVLGTGVGTPYSLTAIIKTQKTLSDGKSISGFSTSRQVRDSQGRTRVDEPLMCQMGSDGQPYQDTRFRITDPVASTYTEWSEWLTSSKKIATVFHLRSVRVPTPRTVEEKYGTQLRTSQASSHAGPTAEQLNVRDLGKRTIAGLEASGARIARMVPAGTMGNSLPLTYVEERWQSDDYRVILLDISDDPDYGRVTYEVTNFTPGEPDASLFQLPAEYQLEEAPLTQ